MSLETLRKLGEADTVIAELVEMFYLDNRPHILDSTETQIRLGVSATPIDEVLRETIAGDPGEPNDEEADWVHDRHRSRR
jgi:hypothetical protein